MGLSVSSLNPISSAAYVVNSQHARSIENESAISSAYRESVGNTATNEGVLGPAPVQYTGRRNVLSGISRHITENRRVSKGLNNIAAEFSGVNTFYDRNFAANSYAVVGQGLDLMA